MSKLVESTKFKIHLVTLDRLLSLIVGLVGVIKSDLELIDLSLQLLLESEGLSLGSLLGLKTGLHALRSAVVVLSRIKIFLNSNFLNNKLFSIY